jgi:hypothetical protein
MFEAAGKPLDGVALDQRVNGLVAEGLTLREVPSVLNPPIGKLAVEWKYARCMRNQSQTDVKPCEFGRPTSKRTLVVYGDSHVMTWMPALDAFAQEHGYRVLALYKASCPVPMVDMWTAYGPYPQCMTWKQRALSYIRAHRPDVIVIGFSRELTAPGRLDETTWLHGLKVTADELVGTGAAVVNISNNPYLPEDPGLCLSRPNADPSRCVGGFQDAGLSAAEGRTMRAAGAAYVDVAPWFCVKDRCPVIIDGTIVYRDRGHITPQYIRRVEPLLATKLVAAGA